MGVLPKFYGFHSLGAWAMNPADPISSCMAGDLCLAREAATLRVGDLWAILGRKMVFQWTLGVPMGPFVLPLAWRSGIRSYWGVGGIP